MTAARATVDSNILIYAALEPGSDKGKRAAQIIRRATPRGILATQALLEFVAVVRRRTPDLMVQAIVQAEAWASVFETAATTATVAKATRSPGWQRLASCEPPAVARPPARSTDCWAVEATRAPTRGAGLEGDGAFLSLKVKLHARRCLIALRALAKGGIANGQDRLWSDPDLRQTPTLRQVGDTASRDNPNAGNKVRGNQ